MTNKRRYKKAFQIACELLNGCIIYGIDAELIFSKMIEQDGIFSNISYEKFILNNLDRFSNNDQVRNRAIERLGW